MLAKSSGARGRCSATNRNQGDSGCQPSRLTDEGLPSPEGEVYNLLADLARAKALFQLRAIAAGVGVQV